MDHQGASGGRLGTWAHIIFGAFLSMLALGGLWILPSFSPAAPSLLVLASSEFHLTAQGRELKLWLFNAGFRSTRLSRVSIDGTEILTWQADRWTLNPKEQTELRLRHAFLAQAAHRVEVEADGGEQLAFEFNTPAIPKMVDASRLQPHLTSEQLLEIDLSLEITGYGSVTLLLEPLASYRPEPLSIYLFDGGLLSGSARAYADAFLRWAERLDPPLSVQRVDWESLERLARGRTAGIVIIFTPLQAHSGPIDDALPAALLDFDDRDQQGLALLQSWLRAGLVLVTPTTTHPLRALLHRDRRVEFPPTTNPGQMLTGKVNTWWSVTARYTQDSAAAKALFWERYQGEYGGVGESADSQLYGYSEATNQFIQGPAEIRGRVLHLYNPFFLRIGQGGWLAFSSSPPAPETLGHDLALLLVHAPWRVEALSVLNPGFTERIDVHGGKVKLDRHITLHIPSKSASTSSSVLVRLMVMAEDADRGRLEHREWLVLPER